jgi:hypothetical protein
MYTLGVFAQTPSESQVLIDLQPLQEYEVRIFGSTTCCELGVLLS